MAKTAFETTKKADGQKVERHTKVKNWGFGSHEQAYDYIKELLSDQEEICALTGLQLQFKDTCDDEAMLCSLDRIDSNGHYEPENLQIVCRFANFWKSNQPNNEFLRLIDELKKSFI